mmetsp:Transcript_12380/g.47698  ORF Transcript_12380/g.47698 Transcript_12380/m.47698 type:complete len:286 (-) Transcript_12380:1428-2285(-)
MRALRSRCPPSPLLVQGHLRAGSGQLPLLRVPLPACLRTPASLLRPLLQGPACQAPLELARGAWQARPTEPGTAAWPCAWHAQPARSASSLPQAGGAVPRLGSARQRPCEEIALARLAPWSSAREFGSLRPHRLARPGPARGAATPRGAAEPSWSFSVCRPEGTRTAENAQPRTSSTFSNGCPAGCPPPPQRLSVHRGLLRGWAAPFAGRESRCRATAWTWQMAQAPSEREPRPGCSVEAGRARRLQRAETVERGLPHADVPAWGLDVRNRFREPNPGSRNQGRD